jgi:hypothetical protein
MTRLVKQFERSTQINVEPHYPPSRVRFDEAEIARRREQAGTGALVLEYQRDALQHIVLQMLDAIEDPNEQAIAAQLLGGTLLSTTGYLVNAERDPSLRHNFKMPLLADETGWRQTQEGLRATLVNDLTDAVRLNEVLIDLRRDRHPVRNIPMKLGKTIGKAALDLAPYPLVAASVQGRPDHVQLMVKGQAQDMHDRAIRLGKEIGVNPSAAMLVDELSPLGVYIQTKASDAIAKAYEEAMNAYKQAA